MKESADKSMNIQKFDPDLDDFYKKCFFCKYSELITGMKNNSGLITRRSLVSNITTTYNFVCNRKLCQGLTQYQSALRKEDLLDKFCDNFSPISAQKLTDRLTFFLNNVHRVYE